MNNEWSGGNGCIETYIQMVQACGKTTTTQQHLCIMTGCQGEKHGKLTPRGQQTPSIPSWPLHRDVEQQGITHGKKDTSEPRSQKPTPQRTIGKERERESVNSDARDTGAWITTPLTGAIGVDTVGRREEQTGPDLKIRCDLRFRFMRRARCVGTGGRLREEGWPCANRRAAYRTTTVPMLRHTLERDREARDLQGSINGSQREDEAQGRPRCGVVGLIGGDGRMSAKPLGQQQVQLRLYLLPEWKFRS